MAVTADWPNYIFHVPRADMTLIQSVPTEIRECNINWLRLQIMALEDNEEGMTFPTVFTHYPVVNIGSLELAKSILMNLPYTVTFEDGQYAVNLVGANSNIGDRANVNQVSVRTANSAGMVNSQAIEFAEFEGVVTIDIANISGKAASGTLHPAGTKRQPVNNIDDALLIASFRGLNELNFIGNATLTSGHDVTGMILTGQSKINSNLTIESPAVTDNCIIQKATLTGVLDGGTLIQGCTIYDLLYVNGFIENCGLAGTIWLDGNADATFNGCFTFDQDNTPTVDMGGTGQSLAMNNYSGIMNVRNFSDPDGEIGIGLSAGLAILEATISDGFITVAGNGSHYDFTTGSTIVNTDGLMNKNTIAESVADQVLNLQQLIESQNLIPGYGNLIYLDYSSGDDLNDGSSKINAVKTFSRAHDLATDHGHDIIFILSAENVIIDEQWIITKEDLSVRGPGHGSITLQPSSTSGPTIQISAGGFDLHSIKVETSATDGGGGDQYCIDIDAGVNGCHFQGCKIANGIEGGMILRDCDGIQINNNIIEHFGGKIGITMLGDCHENIIEDNFIYDMSTGISIGGTSRENWIKGRNLIHDMSTGIKFETAASSTFATDGAKHLYIDNSNILTNMGTEVNNDIGAPGVYYGKDAISAANAAAVWNEELGQHIVGGTFGAEMATKADIAASAATEYTSPLTSTIVYGTNDSGSSADIILRDNNLWVIGEDATNGITVEQIFNLPSADSKPGLFRAFGFYNGAPANQHWLELWAWNYETGTLELLDEEFFPGGNNSSGTYEHEYYERHIDRNNNNEVKMYIVHHVTNYNAAHALSLDYTELASIKVTESVALNKDGWLAVVPRVYIGE